jgi:DNA sulfur modification protein DndD
LCGSSAIFEEFQQKVSLFSKEKRKLEREDDKQKGKKELAREIAEGIIPLSPNIPDKISMQEMIKDEFSKAFKKSFFKDEEDALNYAREKKSIQSNNLHPLNSEDLSKIDIKNIKNLNGEINLESDNVK